MTAPATENKIVLVTRRTRLDELIVRYNTRDQAKFVVESQGSDFQDYVAEHERYYEQKRIAQEALQSVARVQPIDRAYLPNFIFGKNDTVVALGQDGLVANTLKYLDGQPLIGVNPDPGRWDGVLLPFEAKDLSAVAREVWADKRGFQEVTMAKATLNNGQALYGVNDLFIGPKTHFSARYEIALGDKHERHSSSGIIVSTGLGSTGWLASLITGAANIARALARDPVNLPERTPFRWDADHLYYTVREPFPSKVTQTELVFGKITTRHAMRLRSYMPENGVIFSDGIEADYLEFNSGTEATITLAEKRGYLVV